MLLVDYPFNSTKEKGLALSELFRGRFAKQKMQVSKEKINPLELYMFNALLWCTGKILETFDCCIKLAPYFSK